MNAEPAAEVARPDYDAGGLAGVLPAVAASLGVPGAGEGACAPLPEAGRAVVVLVDGLGDELLRRRSGHAPFLRSLLPTARRLTAGFPSTTATSMATFGTGLPPGAHGLVGYEVLIPGEDRLLNELSWENGPDPRAWQPADTVFEAVARAGVDVTRVGPGYFDGSGLTNAALRGGRFRAAESLAARVDATVAALRGSTRALVYLYWGDVDKVGHVHGCESWQWGAELEAVDTELRRLVASVPRGTAVHITADHGMVDVPHGNRLDVAATPALAAGVRHVGGEARAPQLYCEEGAAADVAAAWAETLGERASVRTREQVVDAGLFGLVAPHVRPRIGDVVAVMRQGFAVVDSRSQRPELRALLGLHGALSVDEVAVPLLTAPPR